MFKLLKFMLLAPLLSLTLFGTSKAYSKTCILSMFEPESQFGKKVESVFGFYSEADLFRQAQIKDIDNCFFSGNYDEIVWLSHGSAVAKTISSYSAPIVLKPDGSKIVLPIRYFEKLIKETNYQNLKKVRISICGVDFTKQDTVLHSTIDPFIKNLESSNVEVEISDKFSLGSWLMRDNVTRLDRDWMAKSVKREDGKHYKKWKTEANNWCESDSWTGCDRSEAEKIIPTSLERN
jgi:hypothetical protein